MIKKPRKLKLCKVKGCRNPATTMGHCRIHYLKNWKQIKEKQKKKAIENLNKYIDHIMRKNPDGYVEAIREDLRNSDQLNRKIDNFFFDDEFHDVMDEIGADDVERIVSSLKVDDTYWSCGLGVCNTPLRDCAC